MNKNINYGKEKKRSEGRNKLEEECKEKNRGFDRKIIHASIEQSTIIPISQYIPKEFSLAYATEE